MILSVSLLVYIDRQIYKLTIRMHFDQFNAVKKKKNCISLPPTPFSALPHHALFQTKTVDKSIVFILNIYWSIIVDQIHTYQMLQTELM